MAFVYILLANFPEFTMHGIGFVIHLMILIHTLHRMQN